LSTPRVTLSDCPSARLPHPSGSGKPCGPHVDHRHGEGFGMLGMLGTRSYTKPKLGWEHRSRKRGPASFVPFAELVGCREAVKRGSPTGGRRAVTAGTTVSTEQCAPARVPAVGRGGERAPGCDRHRVGRCDEPFNLVRLNGWSKSAPSAPLSIPPRRSLRHGVPNQVLRASRNPVSVPSPTQATYPSGRTNTAVGAVTGPSTGSSHGPA
jgi:hypothetical protein